MLWVAGSHDLERLRSCDSSANDAVVGCCLWDPRPGAWSLTRLTRRAREFPFRRGLVWRGSNSQFSDLDGIHPMQKTGPAFGFKTLPPRQTKTSEKHHHHFQQRPCSLRIRHSFCFSGDGRAFALALTLAFVFGETGPKKTLVKSPPSTQRHR
jgi:hypothetical protein